MEKTLLKGNTSRQLIALAVPLLLGNILQQLYNAVDSLIIGSFLGTDAFAAAGIAGSVMNLMIFILTGFCVGVSVIFAQAYGAGDEARFRRESFVSAVVGTAVTAVICGVFLPFMRPILRLMNSPEELIPYVSDYLRIIVAGMIATFFYNLLSSLLRSVGNTRSSTVFLLISAVMNTLLDLLFVGPLKMGIAGAAYATVASQLFAAVCCAVYIRRRYPELVCRREDMGFSRELLRSTLSLGMVSALHQSTLYIGKVFVQGAVNLMGSAGIAAYTAATRVEGFANSFGASGAQAESVFISQNYGAKQPERVREGFTKGMLLHVELGLIMSVLMFAAARPGVRIFLDGGESAAIDSGAAYLRLISFFYVLCFTGNSYVGYFRGLGKVQIPLVGTAIHLTIRAVLSFCWVGSMGVKGVALATGIGWVVCFVYQTSMFLLTRRKFLLENPE